MQAMQKRLSDLFYVLLSLPSTAIGFALSVQIAALSWILSTQYNLSIESVGYVWLSGPLAGVVGQLLVGLVSDKSWFWGGRRRPYIIIGGIMAALMLLCLPRLDTIAQMLGINNMIVVGLVVALTLDLAINVSFNPARSIIADVTPLGKARTKGYTIMQTVSGAFGVLAYAISVWLGNYTLIYVGAVLVVLFTLLPPLFITEPRQLSPDNTDDKSLVATAPTHTDVAGLLRIYVAHAFTWLGVQTMFVFTYAFIEHTMQLSSPEQMGKTISTAFLIMNVVGFVLPQLVLTPLANRIGRVATHIICLAIMTLGYAAIYGFGQSPTTLYALMLLVGVGWASVVSIPFAITTEKVSSEKTGLFMGIFNLSVVIPQILVAAFLGKIIGEAPDKNIIFVICTASLALSTLLWLLVKEKK